MPLSALRSADAAWLSRHVGLAKPRGRTNAEPDEELAVPLPTPGNIASGFSDLRIVRDAVTSDASASNPHRQQSDTY